MVVTFLVAVQTESTDSFALSTLADDIHSQLESSFDVESVKPWARPNDPAAQPSMGFTSLSQPTPQPPSL